MTLKHILFLLLILQIVSSWNSSGYLEFSIILGRRELWYLHTVHMWQAAIHILFKRHQAWPLTNRNSYTGISAFWSLHGTVEWILLLFLTASWSFVKTSAITARLLQRNIISVKPSCTGWSAKHLSHKSYYLLRKQHHGKLWSVELILDLNAIYSCNNLITEQLSWIIYTFFLQHWMICYMYLFTATVTCNKIFHWLNWITELIWPYY